MLNVTFDTYNIYYFVLNNSRKGRTSLLQAEGEWGEPYYSRPKQEKGEPSLSELIVEKGEHGFTM